MRIVWIFSVWPFERSAVVSRLPNCARFEPSGLMPASNCSGVTPFFSRITPRVAPVLPFFAGRSVVKSSSVAPDWGVPVTVTMPFVSAI